MFRAHHAAAWLHYSEDLGDQDLAVKLFTKLHADAVVAGSDAGDYLRTAVEDITGMHGDFAQLALRIAWAFYHHIFACSTIHMALQACPLDCY